MRQISLIVGYSLYTASAVLLRIKANSRTVAACHKVSPCSSSTGLDFMNLLIINMGSAGIVGGPKASSGDGRRGGL